MARIRVAEILGISDGQVAALQASGVSNTDQLLARAGAPHGRKELASAANIGEADLLELVNRADLCRIKGVGRQFSNLLEDAGVDSVVELSRRRPDNLLAALLKAAEESGVKRAPRASDVESWVTQAKELPRAVSH